MRCPARGFSLLEMLLVLFVIVVLTSLVTLNVGSGSGGRELQRQLRSLRDVAEYALDEAQYSGRDFGLLLQRAVGDDGGGELWLRWRERLPQGWRAPQRSREVFRDIRVPAGVELELLLDGSAVLPADAAAAAERAGVEPQWLFLASGETQSGEMLWRRAQDGALLWRMDWDPLGRIRLYAGDDPDALATAPL